MMRGLLRRSISRAVLACAGAALFCMTSPGAAQGSYSPYNETASAAMARYLRTLATDPKDFATLIGAGRAAIELGDAQAAAGFFARADEVNPRSPLPQAGMGAVLPRCSMPRNMKRFRRRAGKAVTAPPCAASPRRAKPVTRRGSA